MRYEIVFFRGRFRFSFLIGRMKHAKDMAVSLKYEQEKLAAVVDREAKQLERLQTIVRTIDK